MNPYSICIIGSSHSAALIQAWKEQQPFPVSPDFSLSFFAASGGRLKSLQHENGVLTPADARVRDTFVRLSGKDRVVLADYDAVVLYGFGLRLTDVLEFCERYRTADHFDGGPAEELLSQACFSAAVMGLLASGGGISNLAQIRETYDRPVIVCPTPFPSNRVFQETLSERPALLSDPGFLSSIHAEFTQAVSALTAKYQGDLVPQDENTVLAPCFTKDEFGLGSPTLKAKVRDEYNNHMNADYGALMLMRVLERLDKISGGRVLKHEAPVTLPGAGAEAKEAAGERVRASAARP